MNDLAKYLVTFLVGAVGVALAAFLAVWGVQRAYDSVSDTQSMQLRVYDIGPENAPDVRKALTEVLAGDDNSPAQGRVSVTPSGQLVVLAPASIQVSVSETLTRLGGQARAEAPQLVPTRLELWIVDVYSGDGVTDAALTPITDVLKALQPELGVVHFRLQDSAALAILPTRFGDMRTGRGWRMRADLEPLPDGVRAGININGPGSWSLITTTGLRFGETVVLTEMTTDDSVPGLARRLIAVRATPAGS